MKVQLLRVSPSATNCYLLCDEKTKLCAIIDPGGDASRIADIIDQSEYTPLYILLTHGHHDHTGGVAGLRQHYSKIPVYLNSGDVYDAADRRALQLFPPIDGEVLSYEDGDEITVGQLTVHVVHTPGHTKGSVVLVVEDVVFSGDTLFAGSCGRTDLYDGDWETLLDSLKLLGSYKNDYRVYPGHMESTELFCERDTNPFMLQALRR